jgi:hypothetical protein
MDGMMENCCGGMGFFMWIIWILGFILLVLLILWLQGYWQYTDAMPVVPYLATGLSPLLQMMLLPILTFWLSSRFI